MRTIIAGSRSADRYIDLLKAIRLAGFLPSVVISGTARGADRLGEQFAEENKIPLEKFQADWNKHRKAAGPIRNVKMAENADALIALWDGKSRGTKHMIDTAEKKGLKVSVYRINGVGKAVDQNGFTAQMKAWVCDEKKRKQFITN